MKKTTLSGLVLGVTLVLAQLHSMPAWADGRKGAGGISQVIAFGDSFSDNGVKQKLSTNAVAAGVLGARVKPETVFPGALLKRSSRRRGPRQSTERRSDRLRRRGSDVG